MIFRKKISIPTYVSLFYEIRMSADFDESHPPFVLSDLAQTFSKFSQFCFARGGGINVLDSFVKSNIHVRVAFWDTKAGYSKWQELMSSQNYFNVRQRYMQENDIKQILIQPIKINLNEKQIE